VGANQRGPKDPIPPLLSLPLLRADKLGFLVWDENHRNDVGGQYLDDLRSLVLRDRNHPSVVIWSLCNELLCEGFNMSSATTLKQEIQVRTAPVPLLDAVVEALLGVTFRTQQTGPVTMAPIMITILFDPTQVTIM
jgi:hypothetical protein